MSRRHQPGYQHKTPERDSPGWKRVIARGCGIYHDEMNGDYDCLHGYTWACEDCPVAMERMEEPPDQPQMIQLL